MKTNQVYKYSVYMYTIPAVRTGTQATFEKTERILKHRVEEHKNPTKTNTSSVREHETSSNHQMDYDNVEILDSAYNDNKLRTKELLYILVQKPILNNQLNSQSQYDIKTIIVEAYAHKRG